MIRQVMKGLNGKEIVTLIPENEEDEKELERLAKAGKLDMRDSFADDPQAWKKKPTSS